MDAFYRLAELDGHAHLSPTSCFLCVTSCIAEAHLQHRANTYRTLLWSSLQARSLLLSLLHKQKDPSVLQHCHQLSALLASSGLTSTPDLRKLQMEVGTVTSSSGPTPVPPPPHPPLPPYLQTSPISRPSPFYPQAKNIALIIIQVIGWYVHCDPLPPGVPAGGFAAAQQQ